MPFKPLCKAVRGTYLELIHFVYFHNFNFYGGLPALINYNAKIRRFFETNKEIIKKTSIILHLLINKHLYNVLHLIYIRQRTFFSSLTPPRAPSFLGAFSRVTFLSSLTPLSYALNARGFPSHPPAFGALAYIVQGSGGGEERILSVAVALS